MRRKDCGTFKTMMAAMLLLPAGSTFAETVRVWPSAIVTGDEVRLDDLCAIESGISTLNGAVLETVVAPAPKPGGSRIIDLKQVQRALQQGGANMATVLIVGATECAVSRPSASQAAAHQSRRATDLQGTLRAAVESAFAEATSSLGGRIALLFGRTDASLLDLAGPEYRFDVRIRGGRVLGQLINVDVDILSDGRVVQTLPLVVSATLMRDVVVATTPINVRAPILAEHVTIEQRAFDHVSDISDVTIQQVVGMRAKRFIAAGRLIDRDALETVPLVENGELVDVVSKAGGVTIRTVAKAASSGTYGDLVELRSSNRRGPKLTGYVIGKRQVSMTPPDDANTRVVTTLAMGGKR